MSIAKHSEQNILMLQASTKGLLTMVKHLEDILSNDNDLSQEQIDFWVSQAQEMMNIARNYIEILNQLIEIQNQSDAMKLIPFTNVKNAGLN